MIDPGREHLIETRLFPRSPYYGVMDTAAFREWVESRPPSIRRLMAEFPLGTVVSLPAGDQYVIGWAEDDMLVLSRHWPDDGARRHLHASHIRDGEVLVKRYEEGRSSKIPRMSKETQHTINHWQRITFPEATSEGVLNHLREEIAEFFTTPSGEEAADMVILLYCWAGKNGIDLHEEIDRKMVKNRARAWTYQPDGTGRHK